MPYVCLSCAQNIGFGPRKHWRGPLMFTKLVTYCVMTSQVLSLCQSGAFSLCSNVPFYLPEVRWAYLQMWILMCLGLFRNLMSSRLLYFFFLSSNATRSFLIIHPKPQIPSVTKTFSLFYLWPTAGFIPRFFISHNPVCENVIQPTYLFVRFSNSLFKFASFSSAWQQSSFPPKKRLG